MRMWAYQLTEPGRLDRISVDEPGAPASDEVLIRLTAGGICGSDIVKFTGRAPLSGRDRRGAGFPLHEVCGVVERSAAAGFAVGDLVVGHCAGSNALRQRMLLPAAQLVLAPPGLPATTAVAIQPMATVRYAIDRLPAVAGRPVAVLGLGPIGLMFAHMLADRGAVVTGVDTVDRSAEATAYGLADVARMSTAEWNSTRTGLFDVAVEAIGHQPDTLPHAIDAVRLGGTVYAFGVPDDELYPIPFRTLFSRAITLLTGVTLQWRGALDAAANYLTAHPELIDGPVGYVTHVVELADVNDAYRLCISPAAGRRKVVVSID